MKARIPQLTSRQRKLAKQAIEKLSKERESNA